MKETEPHVIFLSQNEPLYYLLLSNFNRKNAQIYYAPTLNAMNA